MATDALTICNSALSKIGAAKIDSLSDTNKRAILCNQQYSILRDELLRSHPWNFAIKRKYLSETSFTIAATDLDLENNTITENAHGLEAGDKITLSTTSILPCGLSVNTAYYVSTVTTNTFKISTTVAKSVAASEDIITLSDSSFIDGDVTTGTDLINETSHGYNTGDKVRLYSSGTLPTGLAADTDYFVIATDADNYKLASSLANAEADTPVDITAAGGGGTHYVYLPGTGIHTVAVNPNFGWNYKFDLPSDYMRAVRLEPKSQKFVIEDGKLLSNEEEVNLLYVYAITDTTKFDKTFDELLALHLAHQICYDIVQSNSLKETIAAELNRKIRDVRSFDAQEGTPEELETDTYINARF